MKTSGATRATVLIIEDEALVGLYLAEMVEDLGFAVAGPVETAAAALALVDEQPVEIALIDVGLKGDRDGIHAAKQLRERLPLALIFLSGHSDMRDDPRLSELGPVCFLIKPFNPSELEQALRDAFEGSAGRIAES